jgi:hypothetical protein
MPLDLTFGTDWRQWIGWLTINGGSFLWRLGAEHVLRQAYNRRKLSQRHFAWPSRDAACWRARGSGLIAAAIAFRGCESRQKTYSGEVVHPAVHGRWAGAPGYVGHEADAPAEVRGEFKPIGSTIAGVPICEHLPLLSQELHRVALVRSMHHQIVDHNAGAYYALTGRSPAVGGGLIVRDEPDNFPPFGAVVSKLLPIEKPLPAFVQLPDVMSNNG